MITTEARFRVLVKIPKDADGDRFVDLIWESSGSDIEDMERSVCSDGIEVYIYPTCDTRVQYARRLDKLAAEVAKQMGIPLLPVKR